MTLEIFLGVLFALLAFDFINRVEKILTNYKEKRKSFE